jgi:hypothetical protein
MSAAGDWKRDSELTNGWCQKIAPLKNIDRTRKSTGRLSIDPKQGSVFQSGHEQETRNTLDHRGVGQGRRPQISDGTKISTGSGTPEAFARGQALSKFARNEKIAFGRIADTRLSRLPESLCKAAIERPPSIVNAAVDDPDRRGILSFKK